MVGIKTTQNRLLVAGRYIGQGPFIEDWVRIYESL